MNPNEKKETQASSVPAKRGIDKKRGRVRTGTVVKLILALLTAGLCVYAVFAMAGVHGLEIFTVNSTLGRVYARTYRYAALLSGISLVAWIFWAVVLRGRRRIRKAKKASENS